MVLHFTLWSMINFELIFAYSVKVYISFASTFYFFAEAFCNFNYFKCIRSCSESFL